MRFEFAEIGSFFLEEYSEIIRCKHSGQSSCNERLSLLD